MHVLWVALQVGDTALTLACYKNRPEEVKLILALPNVDVNAQNEVKEGKFRC